MINPKRIYEGGGPGFESEGGGKYLVNPDFFLFESGL